MTHQDPNPGRLTGFIGSTPILFAAILFAVLAALGAASAYLYDHWVLASRHAANTRVLAEWVLSGLAAALGFMTSLRMHVRGRDVRWRFATLGSLAVWKSVSLYTAWDEPLTKTTHELFYSRTPELFLFIVAMGIPLVAMMFGIVRAYRKSVDWPVAAAFGVGIAGLSVWTLLFFVPFNMNAADWATRFAAIGLVVGGAAYTVQFFPRVS